MKMITGGVLMVASAVFYLAHVYARSFNAVETTIRFASAWSLVLAVAGTIFILWGLFENHMKTKE